MMRTLLLSFFCFIFSIPVSAQFWMPYPEIRQSTYAFQDAHGFFYSPSAPAPGELQALGSGSSNMFGDPFSRLQIQPANMEAHSDDIQFFAEGGSLQSMPATIYTEHLPVYTPDPRAITIRPPEQSPFSGSDERRIIQPALNLGIVSSEDAFGIEGISVGGAYRLTYHDESFYDETNPYLFTHSYSNLRFGFDSASAADMSTGDLNSFTAGDYVEHRGHEVQLFGTWQPNPARRYGLRVAGKTYKNDGHLGKGDEDENLWGFNNIRSQDYNHIDINLGIQQRLTEYRKLGVQFGWLYGLMQQNIESNHFDHTVSPEEHVLINRREHHIDESGHTWYTGVDFHQQLGENRDFIMSYTFSWLNRDGTLETDRIFHHDHPPAILLTDETQTASQLGMPSGQSINQNGEISGNRYLHKFNTTLRRVRDGRTEAAYGLRLTWLRDLFLSEEPYQLTTTSSSNEQLTVQEEGMFSWDHQINHFRLELPALFSTGIYRSLNMLWGGNITLETIDREEHRWAEAEEVSINQEVSNNQADRPIDTSTDRSLSDSQIDIFGGLSLQPLDDLHLRVLSTPLRLQSELDIIALHQVRFSMLFRI